MIIIIMGVSGSGKTTTGRLLAEKSGLPFYDADDFHSPQSVSKMRKGIPLNDTDRQPWLEALSAHITKWEQQGGAVLACSALKEQYRKILQVIPDIQWVLLNGDRALMKERLQARKDHYMPPELLDSQLEALEIPTYALQVDVANPPAALADTIVAALHLNQRTKMSELPEWGIIGMGVMGKSLALNMAENGIRLSVYNRHVAGKEEAIAQGVAREHPHIQGFDDLTAFVASLERPRRILLMIPAGAAVDAQIQALLPLLAAGDVLLDGGNSFYKDSTARMVRLQEKGIHYLGTGISGGEAGARKGPAIMAGGSRTAYDAASDALSRIAAKDKAGNPCVAYTGPDGSGHFVKMVHNSIEYAEMQLLAETYALLRYYQGLSPKAIADVLAGWNAGKSGSYLLAITVDILRTYEGSDLLLDKVLDQAEQKGTGGWAVTAALEYQVPYGPLAEAVMARALSARKSDRREAAALYKHTTMSGKEAEDVFIRRLHRAYDTVRLLNHHAGIRLLQAASLHNNWQTALAEVARVWTNGCIIRSVLMEELSVLLQKHDNILTCPDIVPRLATGKDDLLWVTAQGLQHGFALPVTAAAATYYLGYVTADSPANLIQAQRDYFGAHTYRRTDAPAEKTFHTHWKSQKDG